MTSSPYQVPLKNQIARGILRVIFRGLFHILADIRIFGQENIPEQGAYLIAMNHVSIYDPPFVVAFWPHTPEIVGAAEIWSRTGQSTLVRLYGGIPIQRGQYNRQSIDRMLAALETGRPLVIAPEGGRSHTPGLRRGQSGVSFLMDQSKVPVIPVGVIGTTDDFFERAKHTWLVRGKASQKIGRPVLQMNIGKAMTLPAISGNGGERRAARQRHSDQIMLQIAGLLPEDYQGVYHTGVIQGITSKTVLDL